MNTGKPQGNEPVRTESSDEPEFQSFLDDLKLLVKEEVAAKLTIVSGSTDHILNRIAMTLQCPRSGSGNIGG